MEIFPANSGPAEAMIIGEESDQSDSQSPRIIPDPETLDWHMYLQMAYRGHDRASADVKFADGILQSCGIGRTERRTAIKQAMKEAGWIASRGAGVNGGYYLSPKALTWLRQQEEGQAQ